MQKKILVTGGTGYIGSHTVVELQNKGFDVIIVDDLSNSSIDVLDGIEAITHIRPIFIQADCCDAVAMNKIFTDFAGIEAIIHFAASKAVGESVQLPLKYYRNNLVSLLTVLDGMCSFNIPNLVFSSSCTVYGQPDILPVTEDAPTKPAESPYGNTKQIAEEIIKDAAHAHTLLQCIALRYFNPIGAHQSCHLGELPNGVPNNLVPYITQTAIGKRSCLSVFGSDYDTPDGSAIRDYIYVVDLAKAHVTAVQRLLEKRNKKSVEFFNLGTGIGLSVLELISEFEQASGVKLNYKIVGRRAGDIEKVWAKPDFANTELNWSADTPIREVLASAWNWEKKIANRG